MALKPLKDLIPVIETQEGGYWVIYKDAEDKIIKKIWHQENMSLKNIYEQDKANRKDKGMFISLGNGESFEGEFIDVEKTTGQFGEMNSFTFIVDGKEKTLNSKSFKLLEGMINEKIEKGDKVKITKEGEGFKTTYKVEKIK